MMLVKDRVCGMELEERDARASLEYRGRRYYFCSVGCRAEFERHPDDYSMNDEEGRSER